MSNHWLMTTQVTWRLGLAVEADAPIMDVAIDRSSSHNNSIGIVPLGPFSRGMPCACTWSACEVRSVSDNTKQLTLIALIAVVAKLCISVDQYSQTNCVQTARPCGTHC